MKSFFSSSSAPSAPSASSASSLGRTARSLLLAALAALAFTAATGACSDDEASAEDRKMSELDDQELVAECNAQRKTIGSEAAAGYQRYICLSASNVGGSCNTNIFENCISVKQPACMAPPAGGPERTCEATVAEARACQVAFVSQYSAYQSVSCAMPPTSQPKALDAVSQCDALCTKCPDLCAEVGI